MRIQRGFMRERELDGKEGWAELGKSGRRMRTVRIPLESGEMETPVTNTGEGTLGYEAFKERYNKRRGIETKYKTVKQRMELENFSGRPADNIKQDFYAVMTVSDMPAHFIREGNREVKKERERSNTRYEYRVNINHAAGVCRDKLIGMVTEERRGVRRRLMKEPAEELERRAVPVRPNREAERNKNRRKARFRHNHKSNC